MKHRRFFIPKEAIKGRETIIREEETIHYIRRVLRLREGNKITLLDGGENRYQARITRIEREEIRAEIERKEALKSSQVRLTLYQALIKAKRFDWLIQKATELGASEIIPFVSRYSLVALSPEEFSRKRKRWQRIARSATLQCGQGIPPEIGQAISFSNACEKASSEEVSFIFWEDENQNLKTILRRYLKAKRVALFVGPEGGFSREEVKEAKEKGIIPASLGSRRLRSETAAIAGISNILYELT